MEANMDNNLIVEMKSGRKSSYYLINDYERFSRGRHTSFKRNFAHGDFEQKFKITKRFARRYGQEISVDYTEFAKKAPGSNFINITDTLKRGYFFYKIDGMTEDQLNASYDCDDGFFDEE